MSELFCGPRIARVLLVVNRGSDGRTDNSDGGTSSATTTVRPAVRETVNSFAFHPSDS